MISTNYIKQRFGIILHTLTKNINNATSTKQGKALKCITLGGKTVIIHSVITQVAIYNTYLLIHA